jgi:hypothetical protein
MGKIPKELPHGECMTTRNFQSNFLYILDRITFALENNNPHYNNTLYTVRSVILDRLLDDHERVNQIREILKVNEIVNKNADTEPWVR